MRKPLNGACPHKNVDKKYVMSHRPRGERFEGIELLRFALALGVVVYHYYFFGPHDGLIRLAPIDGLGLDTLMFGVEAFFAVSGFVIVLSAAGRTPVQFMLARMARLAPTLLVASTVTLLVYYALAVEPPVSHAQLKYLVSITFFPLARLSGGLDPSLWSLSFEIRFYALIFVCMFAFDVQANALRVAVALLAYDALRLILSALFGHGLPTRIDVLRDYSPFFAIGILFYHRHATRTFAPMRVVGDSWTFGLALAVALFLGAVRCTQLFDHMDHLTLHIRRVAFWQGALVECAIAALMLASLRAFGSAPAAKLFRVLGRASYPLYVVHQLCGYWMINFLAERRHLQVDTRPLIIVFMVAVSLAFGNWIEPALIRLYRRVLEDGVAMFATWVPPRRPSLARVSGREG